MSRAIGQRRSGGKGMDDGLRRTRRRALAEVLVAGVAAGVVVLAPPPLTGVAQAEVCAPAAYSYRAVDAPNAGVTQVRDLNEAGQVVGRWGASDAALRGVEQMRGFVHDLGDGSFTPLELDAFSTYPEGIAEDGVVSGFAGRFDQAGGLLAPTSGFRWLPNPDGSADVEPVEYPGLGDSTFAFKTNAAGDVAGFAVDGAGSPHSYVASGTGPVEDVAYPGAVNTYLSAIDDTGRVGGGATFANGSASAFTLSAAGTPTVVTIPCGAIAITDLNTRGDIAGHYQGADGNQHGVVIVNGVASRIDYPGASETRVFGIDESGQVAGEYRLPGEEHVHGFVGLFPVDLELTATDAPDPATTGEAVTERYVVTNRGAVATSGFLDLDAAGLASTPAGCFVPPLGTQLRCPLNGVAAGAEVVTVVQRTYATTGTRTHRASVLATAPAPDGNLPNNSVEFTTTVIPPRVTLSVSPPPGTNGRITGPGIDCGSNGFTPSVGDCSETYDARTVVTLRAERAVTLFGATSAFYSWGGACAPAAAAATCQVTMTSNQVVCAAFHVPPSDQFSSVPAGCVAPPQSFVLTVSPRPGEYGKVRGPGIDCGSDGGVVATDCSERFVAGAVVDLSVSGVLRTSGLGDVFFTTLYGWGGWCASRSTEASCQVTMAADRTVCAAFQGGYSGTFGGDPFAVHPAGCLPPPTTYVLTVSPRPGQYGRITGPGINCGTTSFELPATDCSERVLVGTVVPLQVESAFVDYGGFVPTFAPVFYSWGGACAGVTSTACSLTMTVDHTVCAAFFPSTTQRTTTVPTGCAPPPPPVTLVVSPPPGTFGRISGPGINCGATSPLLTGSDCSQTYAPGTFVTLTASPFTDALGRRTTFSAWGAACSPLTSTTCTVFMTADKTVCATFRKGTTTGPTTCKVII